MPRQRLQLLALLAGAIAALMLLASGVSTLTFRPGRLYDVRGLLSLAFGGGAAPEFDPTTASFWQSLFGLISLALVLFTVVALIVSPKLRREFLRRMLLVAAVVLLLYMFAGLVRSLAPPAEGAPPTSTSSAPAESVLEPLPAFDPRPTPWLAIGVSVLVVGVLLAGIWLVWRRERPRPAPVARLADEAQAALANIQAGGDLADTVLRCYHDMSRVLAEERGITRPQAATPREFERQLAAAGLRDEHIQQLTRLFERVRYGARRADEREKEAAVACLTAIVQTYGSTP